MDEVTAELLAVETFELRKKIYDSFVGERNPERVVSCLVIVALEIMCKQLREPFLGLDGVPIPEWYQDDMQKISQVVNEITEHPNVPEYVGGMACVQLLTSALGLVPIGSILDKDHPHAQ